MKRILLAVAVSTLPLACAMKGQSIKDVPTIKSENIHAQLRDLPKKELSLTIVDSRKTDVRAQSETLRAEVRRAVAEALEKNGTAVLATGANNLTLTIEDYETGKFKEGCVKTSGLLLIPQKAKVKAEASACNETRNPFGSKLSADITKAYEEALSLLFKNLDSALSEVYQR